MSQYYYTKEHDWFTIEGDMATVGITDYAQRTLGGIVYVEILTPNSSCNTTDTMGLIESVKTASDFMSPFEDGFVFDINPDVKDNPSLINEDAEGKAWIVKIQVKSPHDPETLEKNFMNHSEYMEFINGADSSQ